MSYRTISATRTILFAGAAAIIALPAQALAQDQEQIAAEANEEAEEAAADSGEIVVTARRRAEALQDVPIAVTAYSGAQLEREGVMLAVSDVGLRFHGSARYDDPIRVYTRLIDVRSRGLTFAYRVKRADTDALLVGGTTALVSLSRDGKPITLPMPVRTMLAAAVSPS